MVLANLQKQLLQQSAQLELFRELVKVEKDMFILLLSMLEGNLLVVFHLMECDVIPIYRQHQCVHCSQDDIHTSTIFRTC